MQPGDEVRLCGGLPQARDQVMSVGVPQSTKSRPYGQCAALDESERDVARIVWWWTVEDGEGAGAEGRGEAEELVECPGR